jgi:hypothetical protein
MGKGCGVGAFINEVNIMYACTYQSRVHGSTYAVSG